MQILEPALGLLPGTLFRDLFGDVRGVKDVVQLIAGEGDRLVLFLGEEAAGGWDRLHLQLGFLGRGGGPAQPGELILEVLDVCPYLGQIALYALEHIRRAGWALVIHVGQLFFQSAQVIEVLHRRALGQRHLDLPGRLHVGQILHLRELLTRKLLLDQPFLRELLLGGQGQLFLLRLAQNQVLLFGKLFQVRLQVRHRQVFVFRLSRAQLIQIEAARADLRFRGFLLELAQILFDVWRSVLLELSQEILLLCGEVHPSGTGQV